MQRKEVAALIISLLFALIVKAGLENFFYPILKSDAAWQGVTRFHWVQGALFFVLVVRFFFGAIRYVDTEYKNLPLIARCVNLIFAFLLFSGFYVVALAIRDTDKFFLLIMVVHGIDIGWFFTGRLASRNLTDAGLEQGEVKITAIQQIMHTYMVFSAITVAVGFIVYFTLGGLFDPKENVAHWSYVCFLFLISVFDFYWFRQYYFDFENWKVSNAFAKG